jgi:hypothetical protein
VDGAADIRVADMCDMVYLATDCGDDLSRRSSDLVRFEKPSVDAPSPPPRVLTQEHKWFVGSKSGCSCTFRHLCRESVSLGFGAPEDWFPEEQIKREATRELYGTLSELVQRGHHVELIDCWSGDEDKDGVPLEVSLTEVSAERFRLFEGHLFNLKP